MTRSGFVYFLVGFVFMFIALSYILLSVISFNPIKLETDLVFPSLIAIFLTLLFGGLFVDKFKNRVKLLLISGIILIVGLVLVLFQGTIIQHIGFFLIIFACGVFFIDELTILTHETSILNRGRLIGYFFFFSFIISTIFVYFTKANIIAVLIAECVLFVMLLYIYTQYTYVETDERLRSDLKFRELTIKHPVLGYLTAFMVLGFVLGNAFPVEMNELFIDPLVFVIIILLFFVITGVFLDNMGRKWSFTGGVFIIASLIIFAGIFKEIYSAIFFGISLSIIFLLVFTLTCDFATERNAIRYRGRITSIFLLYVIGGFIGGIFLKYILLELYYTNEELYFWMPDLINGINSFLLIVLLVWIMPLPEIFSAKESDWASTLKNLYVFNRDSICLYAKNFLPETNMVEDLPSEDLITGGLTGILTLISEITNEKKNLRIIDKERVKIYFAYGKTIISALISTKFLPILTKKLELFTKVFEKTFEDDLLNFRGKINIFLNKTDPLVERYFK
ncbi:MAG: hypothetical protein ACTSQJ_10080 [Promethearchaeota archaeon]